MPAQSLATEAFVLLKRPPADAFQTFTVFSAEHGTLLIGAGAARPAPGDVVKLIPGHCDPTVNLYDWLVTTRAQRVEAVWPVTARGCVS